MKAIERYFPFVALALTAAVTMIPIYWMIMTATMPTSMILSRNPPLLPDIANATLEAFATVIERKPFLVWTVNSLIVAIGASLVSLLVAVLAGYSLSRWSFFSQRLLAVSLLLSKLLPAGLIIIPIFIMFNVGGLIDSFPALIMVNVAFSMPLACLLMKQFFDRVPRELDEAAMLDGCTRIGALRQIILPLVRPGLASTAMYLLLVNWSEFLFARTLITSTDKRLLTVGLQSFAGEYLVDWSALMAAATLTLIPIAIIFVLLEPFLVSGATKGAISK
jgi:multiple sugar transport system permease protein